MDHDGEYSFLSPGSHLTMCPCLCPLQFMYVCVCVCMCVCYCLRACVCMCMLLYMCVYVCVCMFTCVYVCEYEGGGGRTIGFHTGGGGGGSGKLNPQTPLPVLTFTTAIRKKYGENVKKGEKI